MTLFKGRQIAIPGRELFLSLGLAIFTAVIAIIPGCSEVLQFEQQAVAHGEVWRMITGHFCHWNLDHLFWDLSMFLLLGILLERDQRPRMLICLGLCVITIIPAIAIYLPEFETYRGLSGIDSGLFVLLMTLMLKDGWREKQYLWSACCLLGILGLMGKTLFEMKTGATLFVDHEAAGMIPIPLSHLLGGVSGFVAAIWPISVSNAVPDHLVKAHAPHFFLERTR